MPRFEIRTRRLRQLWRVTPDIPETSSKLLVNEYPINNGRTHVIECPINSGLVVNEPPHDKTNKLAWAPSEDSDEPGHPPSLIRVFAVLMKKAWVLSYPLSAQGWLWSDCADASWQKSTKWHERPAKTQISLGICPVWLESSLSA